MGYETLLVEKQGHVTVLTLNRPPNNAISTQMLREIDRALDEAAADREARVLVITGAGDRSFCAGMDVMDAISNPNVGPEGAALWTRVDSFDKPVLAAINGHALGGGCELAMACHFRFMAESDKAKMGCPELNLGIIPGWGGTQRMTRLLGPAKALDLILFSRRLSPQEALRIGLINGVFTAEELLPRVLETAGILAEKAPLAVKGVIRSIRTYLNRGIEEGHRVELEEAGVCAASKDAVEGFTAFIQKRKPAFKGE